MLKMVDGTGIIGVDMICPLGGAVSPPQPPNFDKVEMEGVGSLMLPNSLKAPLERVELIGNSVQGENPAPDNPQEIKSAGRKSKNLFDAKKAKSGWIAFDGKQTLATLGSIDNVISDYIQVYPGMNYTSSASVYQNFYDSEKNFLNHNPNASTSIVVPDNAKYMIVVVAVNRALVIQTANALMINIGSSALPYEQYTDKYLLDVKVTGKNLFPYSNDFSNWKKYVNDSYFGSVTSDESGIKAEVLKLYAKIVSPTFKLKPNTKYTISAMIDTKDKSLNIGVRIFKNLNVSDYLKQIVIARRKSTNTPQKVSATFTTDDLKDVNEVYLQLDCSWGDTVLPTIVTFYDIQLELGNNATNYEPYTEQAMQIVLDEPLRGIGEYKDTITKDGVVRKIKRVVLNGSEGWGIHKEKETTVSFWTNSFKFLFPTHNMMLVDKFAYVISGMNKEDVSWSVYGSNFYININKDIASNLESFKTWLSQNPVTVVYIATEPTTEPLPQSVQAQLQALRSENGVTHVFVDSGEVPCGIKLTYRKEI